MSLGSLEFIYIFMPLFCAAYYLMPAKYRNILLFGASCAFYIMSAWSAPAAIALLFASALVNWGLGLLTEKAGRYRAAGLAAGIIWNIGILFFFKYINKISPDTLQLLGDIGFSTYALPLGLSFYSFRAAGYLADVYHARTYAESNPFRYILWFSFFPTVLQGPITRYPDSIKQINERTYSPEGFTAGLRTYILGLGFKTLLADRLMRLWTKASVYEWVGGSTAVAWLAVIAYSLYIYFDFAGYSLMAIGTGRMLGFELPENFAHPYTSKSMTEFWRRWHITLGAWFRDYIYIPLGGSRKGIERTLANLMCVWIFTGLWHGSTLNFLIWGAGLGFIIIIEKLWLKKYLDKSRVLCHIYMAFLIVISWAVFAVTDLGRLGLLFTRLFPFLPQSAELAFNPDDWKALFESFWPYLAAGLVCCTGLPEWLEKKYGKTVYGEIVLAAIFIASVLFIAKTGSDPFAYGNF